MFYVDRMFNTLNAMMNADGSVVCVSLEPANSNGFPFDHGPTLPIRFNDGDEFPVFAPRQGQITSYMQLYIDHRMIAIYPPKTQAESPTPHFTPYIGTMVSPNDRPGRTTYSFHPTKPAVYFAAGGALEPMGQYLFGSNALTRSFNIHSPTIVGPLPEIRYETYLGSDHDIRNGMPPR
jgi:hypothetical protein